MAAASGSDYLVSVAPSISADYPAGTYKWESYITISGTRVKDRSGTIEIKQNFAAATSGVDTRSHVKIVLDAIEAVIEKRATKDQASYSISGVSLSRIPVQDLLVLRDRYKGEYLNELSAEKLAKGMRPGGSKVLVRFQ